MGAKGGPWRWHWDDRDNMGTAWGQCGNNTGTAGMPWGPQGDHGDDVGTTWGPWGPQIEIIQFCLKLYDLWRVVGWIGGLMGGSMGGVRSNH